MRLSFSQVKNALFLIQFPYNKAKAAVLPHGSTIFNTCTTNIL